MDYKEKYEQALKRAKGAHDSAKADIEKGVEDKITQYTTQLTEIIFPELKESEDERIRKELINFFSKGAEYDSSTNGIKDRNIIAWLEKQDPKKHEEELEKAYKCADEVQYRKGYEDAKREIENQNKQKPAWSEEDEKGLGDALWAVQQARTIAKDENDMGNLWYAENWIKSLKERYTWKPSDEQMNFLWKYAEQNNYDGRVLTSLFRDLKKLREE